MMIEVKIPDRTVRVKKPLKVSLRKGKDGWTCDCSRLKLWAWGKTQREAVWDLQSMFWDVYDGLDEPDAKLSPDAQELRDKLKALVEIR